MTDITTTGFYFFAVVFGLVGLGLMIMSAAFYEAFRGDSDPLRTGGYLCFGTAAVLFGIHTLAWWLVLS